MDLRFFYACRLTGVRTSLPARDMRITSVWLTNSPGSPAGTRTVLLADEPSGALDSENSTKLFELLHQLTQEGSTVLCVTHDPLAIQYSDQVFSMDAGVLSPISHHDISQTYDFLR